MTTYAGTSGNDTLVGTTDADTFDLTLGGNDTLSGLSGDDQFLLGGALTAADHIDGGDGYDTVVLNGDYDSSVSFGPTTITNVERINLAAGNSYRLTLDAATAPSGTSLTIDGSAVGFGDFVFLYAPDVQGNLTLSGSVLLGGRGDDILNGIHNGGTVLFAATQGVTVDLSAGTAFGPDIGHDTLVSITNAEGGSGNDTLRGDGGNNGLSGNDGNDTLIGGAGNDMLSGNRGDDVLDGGSGVDTAAFSGTGGSETIDLIAGTASGPVNGNDTLVSIENIYTGTGNDIVTGDGNDNHIEVGTGINVVHAGAGNDYVYDQGSGSTLDGGDGQDRVAIDRSALTAAVNLTFAPGSSTAITLPDGTSTVNFEYFGLSTGSGNDSVAFIHPLMLNALYEGNGWDAGAGTDALTLDLSNFTTPITMSHPSWDVVWAGSSPIIGFSGVENLNIIGGSAEDVLSGGWGNDTFDGGSSADTVVFAGNKSAYTITQTSTGKFTITGADGTDTLTNIEYAKFDDQIMRLLPGTGTTVNWSDPTTYMGAIRDFDGNDLGGAASWKLIGTADVNGDGRAEHILFNREIGRWAEVGTETDTLTYFANNGWAGDTRVVGIYIDPLVTQGIVVKGSDTDSQRRFQNDLNIENINGILGQGDYNHDGLQEIYFSLTDGTAYLHAYMHADGNIQYANYQNKQQVIDYLTGNGISSSSWAGWFPSGQSVMAAVAG